MTYARKVDANHGTIKLAFEQMGCSVADLSSLGGGVLDLLVAIPMMNVLVEVKREGGKLRGKKQQEFYRDWKGPKAIVHTTDEAIALVAYMGEIARKLA